MKFDDLVNLVLEANLYNKKDLLSNINELLLDKNVQKQQIKDWFLKQYVGWYISSKDDDYKLGALEIGQHKWEEGQPEWAKKSDIMYFYGFSSDKRDYLNHVIDYFNQLDENELNKIYKKPYEVVRKEVAEWDDYLASQTYKGPPLEEGIDVQTVMKFNNGYRWEKLITQQAYTAEGEMLGHCVGRYCEDKNSVIYSLKDPKNGSHVTIEYYLSDNAITQIKGKRNEAPVEKYRPYIKDFITKFNFNVINDGQNIGMVSVYSKEIGINYFYFKDSPQYLVALKNKKEQSDLYIKEIFETAKKTNNIVYNIDLTYYELTELPDFSNLTVLGHFDISHNNLTSLKGSPKTVQIFNCSFNNLTSLEGGPSLVQRYFAEVNQITSLKGAPIFTDLIEDKEAERPYMIFDLSENKIEHIDMKDIKNIFMGVQSSSATLSIFLAGNPIADNKEEFLKLKNSTNILTGNNIRIKWGGGAQI